MVDLTKRLLPAIIESHFGESPKIIEEKIERTIPDWAQRIIDLEERLLQANDRISNLETLVNTLSNTTIENPVNIVELIDAQLMRTSIGTGSQNANYIHISPGFLLQWGTFTHAGGTNNRTAVSFAKPYLSANSYSVTATYAFTTQTGVPIRLNNTSEWGFTATGMECNIRWIAVGYSDF